MRTRHIWVAVALVGALAGCGGGDEPATSSDPAKLDEAGNFACTDFAKGYKAAQTKQARTDLADKVNKWASTSGTTGISDAGAALGRGADGSADAWQVAADAFAVRCTDAGWTAKDAS